MKLLFCMVSLLFSSVIQAQGNLEPADPPGPTMKTLTEVEPRTHISEAGTISDPGSYYLSNNIIGSIHIEANSVNLDLNGFTISVPGENGIGILVTEVMNARIYNGRIIGAGNAAILGAAPGNIAIEDVHMINNGICVNMVNPLATIEIQRLYCDTTVLDGIRIVGGGENPIRAIVRDSTITNANTDTKTPRAAIGILHGGTGFTSAIVSNNRVIGNNGSGIAVVGPIGVDERGGGGPAEEFTAGSIMNNVVHESGGTGIFVVGDFLVSKNVSMSNNINYNLDNASNAAPISEVGFSPNAWDNIANELPF